MTKDSDFVASFHLRKSPPKLLLISTGNIDNSNLLTLILTHLDQLERAFEHLILWNSAKRRLPSINKSAIQKIRMAFWGGNEYCVLIGKNLRLPFPTFQNGNLSFLGILAK